MDKGDNFPLAVTLLEVPVDSALRMVKSFFGSTNFVEHSTK